MDKSVLSNRPAGFDDDFVTSHFGEESSDVTDEPIASINSNGSDAGKSRSNFYVSSDLLDSPDVFSNLPHESRESIAMGATSLAARESIVKLTLSVREDEYIEHKPYRVFVGTWNVNGQMPSTPIGDSWLACDPAPPDLYAIGFQELDLSKEAFLFSDSPRESEWLQACIRGLHPKASYVKVKLIRLVGMMLVVFVKEELIDFVTNVAAETVGTGLLGKMGNKGAVAVRFDFCNTSYCFVNCHLAAHVEEYERRNQDYTEILSRMTFSGFRPPKFIKDHEQIYWFGDLNYRITNITSEEVRKMINERQFVKLLDHDQFKIQHNLKKTFVGFVEGEIKHMPTYKYDPGTDNWDSSEKNRPPAWCDRVLWQGGPTEQICYRSHPKLQISDHKPVSGYFKSMVKVVNQTKYRKIYEDVMKKLDRLENEFLPQVTVDKMEINFGSLSFRDPITDYLTIANTGQVPVRFEFTKKPNQPSYCKEWLIVNPYTDVILPGSSIEAELKVYVDKNSASKLNAGTEAISDILVLHLEHGRDLFITITGTYLPSCFGSSINSLVRMKQHVREVELGVYRQLQKHENSTDMEQCWDIPKEIFILVDHIYKYGMTKEDLFQQPGLITEFRTLRDYLDLGWPEKVTESIHSVAEALLLLLDSFSEPVIPYILYQKALDAGTHFTECKKIIAEIPKAHRHVFYYLISFMRELLRHSNFNKLEQKVLASVFGSILIRAPETSSKGYPTKVSSVSAQQALEKKKSNFIYQFLVNEFDV